MGVSFVFLFFSASHSLAPKTGNVDHQHDRKERHDLQKEVLGSLFTVPERSEKEPKKCGPVKEVRRSSVHHRVVEEPLKETTIEHRPVIKTKQVIENSMLLRPCHAEILYFSFCMCCVPLEFMTIFSYFGPILDDEENENSYDVLRKAVAEHWVTMKEYYKAVNSSPCLFLTICTDYILVLSPAIS